MSFWSSEKLRIKIPTGLITPFDLDRIRYGAYELSLGHEAFVTSDDKERKQSLEEKEQLVIPPGQFGLLLSEEEVHVPDDAIGFISIKAGIKFRGLVNVSGFHVDPGFSGKLKFSVFNAGSQNMVLTRKQAVFLIWFCDLDQKTKDIYHGDHANQKEISSEDVMRIQGKVHSPAALDKRLTDTEISLSKRLSDVERRISTINKIAIGVASASIAGVLAFLGGKLWSTYIDKPVPPHQDKTAIHSENSGNRTEVPIPSSSESRLREEISAYKAKESAANREASKAFLTPHNGKDAYYVNPTPAKPQPSDAQRRDKPSSSTELNERSNATKLGTSLQTK